MKCNPFRFNNIHGVLATSLLALSLGCAKPMSSNLGSCVDAQCSSSDGSVPGGGGNEGSGVLLDPIYGEITEGLYKSYKVVDIDPATKIAKIHLPFPAMALIPGLYAEAPVPGLPGAHIEVRQALDGTGGLTLFIPLEYLLFGGDLTDGDRLPNGDPLPTVPGGELPSFAVALHPSEDVEVLVYLGKETVGILYWSSFDTYIGFSAPIWTEAMTHPLGYFHAIPHKRNFSTGQVTYPRGGFFLSISLPNDLRRTLDDLF